MIRKNTSWEVIDLNWDLDIGKSEEIPQNPNLGTTQLFHGCDRMLLGVTIV
jgi:hypothetical protein